MLLYLALIQIEWFLFLVSGNIVLFFKLVLRLLFHCEVLLALDMVAGVRLREVKELSITNNLLALVPIILQRHLHISLYVIPGILIPNRGEFRLLITLSLPTHSGQLRLTLGHPRAQILLVVLI